MISFPPPTKMLQFGGSLSLRGMAHSARRSHSAIRGSKRFMPLPATYRSLSRPSSALEPSHPQSGCSIRINCCTFDSSPLVSPLVSRLLDSSLDSLATLSPRRAARPHPLPLQHHCRGALKAALRLALGISSRWMIKRHLVFQ